MQREDIRFPDEISALTALSRGVGDRDKDREREIKMAGKRALVVDDEKLIVKLRRMLTYV